MITSLPRAKFNFPWAPGYLWYAVLYKQEERSGGGVWHGRNRPGGQSVPSGTRALAGGMGHPHLARLPIGPQMGVVSIGTVIHSLVPGIFADPGSELAGWPAEPGQGVCGCHMHVSCCS